MPVCANNQDFTILVMNLGIGQIFLLVLIFILLFGNFPKIVKDLAEGIKNFLDTFKTR